MNYKTNKRLTQYQSVVAKYYLYIYINRLFNSLMHTEPLISVMILAYNHEKYIHEAIQGALMQKCSYNFEVVVCDDCSTDNTRSICQDLQNKFPDKIRLILNQKNKGLIINYFETMKECRGKYIADCSGDDYWIDPYKLQKQVDILERDKDIVLVHTNWKDLLSDSNTLINDVKSRKLNRKTQFFDYSDMTLYVNHKNYSLVNINTACFKKNEALDIYDKNLDLFDGTLYPCEDFQLLFLLLSRGKFYYIDEDTSVYRILNESVSQTQDMSRKFNYELKFTHLRMTLAKKYKLSLSLYLDLISPTLFYLAFKTKDVKLATTARETLHNYGYTMPFKARIMYYISNSQILIALAYPCYKLLKQIKALAR